MKVGERIREIRKRRGLTQDQVVVKLGMTRANFSNYERGTAKAPAEILSKIASILGTSTDYLLGRTESDTVDDSAKALASDIQCLGESDRELLRSMIRTMIERK